MEKKDISTCENGFWMNALAVICMLVIIIVAVCVVWIWISGTMTLFSEGQFRNAFGWFVIIPMVVACFAFFFAFCETMGDSGDGW